MRRRLVSQVRGGGARLVEAPQAGQVNLAHERQRETVVALGLDELVNDLLALYLEFAQARQAQLEVAPAAVGLPDELAPV